jgi:multidrug efflux pump subunit AcrB
LDSSGEKQIPAVARMRVEERARLEDLQNLYVYSRDGKHKVPVGLVAKVDYGLQTERIQRRDQFRTVTVGAYPAEGFLASEVLTPLMGRLKDFRARLPPGYRMEIGGEYEKQMEGFGELAVVMAISALGIFLALTLQFKNVVKPLGHRARPAGRPRRAPVGRALLRADRRAPRRHRGDAPARPGALRDHRA